MGAYFFFIFLCERKFICFERKIKYFEKSMHKILGFVALSSERDIFAKEGFAYVCRY